MQGDSPLVGTSTCVAGRASSAGLLIGVGGVRLGVHVSVAAEDAVLELTERRGRLVSIRGHEGNSRTRTYRLDTGAKRHQPVHLGCHSAEVGCMGAGRAFEPVEPAVHEPGATKDPFLATEAGGLHQHFEP